MQIEPWHMSPVPTYRVNKHKDRRDIRHQTADSRGGRNRKGKDNIWRGRMGNASITIFEVKVSKQQRWQEG
jgi:hypothetical protein